MPWSTKSKKNGFSLVEIIIALGLFSIMSGALLLLLNMGLKIIRDDKNRSGASAIALEKIEIIKNLPYNDVGIIGGIPAGSIPATETTTLNGIIYTITTNINYVDDPYDGLITSGDLLNTDYKKVKVKASWQNSDTTPFISYVTNIVPKDLEQAASGDTGTLWLEIYDSTPSPLENADISIINYDSTPPISMVVQSDVNGQFILPGAPIGTQNYQITATKANYSISQTYTEDVIINPHPDPAHLSIGKDSITTKSFFIDILSNLNITVKTYDTDMPIPDFFFTLSGNKTIGTNSEGEPIQKYQHNFTSDSSGQVILANIEPDTFNINFDNETTGFDLAGSSLNLPLILAPDSTDDLTIYLAPHSENTLLLTVSDADGSALADANIHLYNTVLPYDQTFITNANGQYFITPINSANYFLEISKSGFENYLSEINVSGQTQQTISLATPPI